MDVAAKPRTWRGMNFDSQLEADWAKSLTTWGVAFEFHPGQIWDWQPDFLLPGDEDLGISDVLLEVKGAHDLRLDKARRIAEQHNASVVIGRVGMVPPGSNVEQAGAVWHNAIPGGDEFFVWYWGVQAHFVPSTYLASTVFEGTTFASAERCVQYGALDGLPMWKVV